MTTKPSPPTVFINGPAICALKCYHGCDEAIVGVYHFPDGCVCADVKIQALCLHHAKRKRAVSNIVHGEMIELARFV